MIIQGDCREVLPTLNQKIDIVITSPPYNMNLRIRKGKYASRQIVKEFSTKYADYNDNLDMSAYFELNRFVVGECLRLAPLCFYNVQFLTGNKPALFKLMGHYAEQLKEFIVWDKLNAQPAMHAGVLNSQWEALLVFGDNPISRQFSRAQFARGTLSNLWHIKKQKSPSDTHGAIFPEQLVETILNNFTQENATVLDPFAGLGTVGVVAKRLNRNYILIEQSANYCDHMQAKLL